MLSRTPANKGQAFQVQVTDVARAVGANPCGRKFVGAEDDALMHGGALDAAAARYGIPRDGWLDLSTGINPNAYPVPDLAPDYWRRLPDSDLYGWLRETAARAYRVADPVMVVPAPGSQMVIQWVPRLIPAARVAILGPTYGEHEKCWAAAGHGVSMVAAPEDVDDGTGVVVVVNPNNPTGRIIERERLLRLAENRLLVVDEAFADVAPDASVAPLVGRPGLLVMRSVGKFFGLPGMRLGFALAERPLADRIREAVGPWAVSGPAAAVGAVALSDETWIRAARVRLRAATARMDGLLIRMGLRLVGGTTLFRLIEHSRSGDLYDLLSQSGILARPCPANPDWLRFGMPGYDADFERLLSALADWPPAKRTPATMVSG
jgi:cobalamin biosynthetic protein CobC